MSNIEPVKADKKLLSLIQDKRPNFHPAMILAEIAEEAEDVQIRLNAAKALMPYCAPQLKSMEVYGEVKHDHGQLKVSIKAHKEEPLPIDITPEPDQLEDSFDAEIDEDLTDDDADAVLNEVFGID